MLHAAHSSIDENEQIGTMMVWMNFIFV
jgi:hypothetical protein